MTDATIAFGPFELDIADRRLLCGGQAVEVSARYFDALVLLASESGRLVTKDRFHEQVWRGIPVTDEALTQCIRSLRRALDDDASAPRYIETVPRHGYRFIAPVAHKGRAAATTAPETYAASGPVARAAAAAAMGGGIAGIVAALLTVSVGLVRPAMGTASTVLVLVSINLLLGIVAGAVVGAAMTVLEHRGSGWWRPIAGGAAGGLLIGAMGHVIGSDLFELLFGRSPGAITGAGEGALVGAAAGLGHAWASRAPAGRSWQRLAPGFMTGAIGGIAIALAGGKLMAGSLAELALRFPGSRLGIGRVGLWLGEHGFGPVTLALATAIECALFTGGVVLALALSRRLRGS